MKKTILLICSMLLAVLLQAQAQHTMRIATYNIRYDNKNDTVNAWKDRLPVMANLVRFHDFDIMGTQEGLVHQLHDLAKELNGYAYIGKGRDDGKEAGEFSAIFYKKGKFKLLQEGAFWLSPTPEKPAKGWDAALPRVCTWGQFTDIASGINFYVFNTHFDHRGEEARRESTKQLLATIRKMAGTAPVTLTGDFNFSQQHENYQTLASAGFIKDAHQVAEVRYAPNGTFNGFDFTRKTDERIDHIFLSNDFKVARYGILTDSYNGKFPSDHFPVMIEVKYGKQAK